MTRATTIAALALALALAACGDNAAVPRDAAPDAAAGCVARFTGNFAETSVTPACAMLAPGTASPPQVTLSLAIASTTLGGKIDIAIDLGAVATPGDYGPETVASWSARGVKQVGSGACVFLAGNMAVPQGDFALTLTDADAATGAAHGTLELDQAVLAFPSTDCGDVDTERTDLTF